MRMRQARPHCPVSAAPWGRKPAPADMAGENGLFFPRREAALGRQLLHKLDRGDVAGQLLAIRSGAKPKLWGDDEVAGVLPGQACRRRLRLFFRLGVIGQSWVGILILRNGDAISLQTSSVVWPGRRSASISAIASSARAVA